MAIKHFHASAATDPVTGKATLSVTIPGTFTALLTDPANSSAWKGRVIKSLEAKFDNGAEGDYIDNIQVTDPNGKVPVPARALFPNYPVLADRMDADLLSGKGLWLWPGQLLKMMSDSVPIASELVLSADFYAVGGGARSDTIRANIYWDDGT